VIEPREVRDDLAATAASAAAHHADDYERSVRI
jgi:hypothetical protein